MSRQLYFLIADMDCKNMPFSFFLATLIGRSWEANSTNRNWKPCMSYFFGRPLGHETVDRD